MSGYSSGGYTTSGLGRFAMNPLSFGDDSLVVASPAALTASVTAAVPTFDPAGPPLASGSGGSGVDTTKRPVPSSATEHDASVTGAAAASAAGGGGSGFGWGRFTRISNESTGSVGGDARRAATSAGTGAGTAAGAARDGNAGAGAADSAPSCRATDVDIR